MTTAVYFSGTPSLAVPHTQNTAPVLEFNCMYTHDIRRKQKRWQDGFVRFHTFNKRVMVYDIPRNLIGDTHWKADTQLQDGDEVLLESDGVMVQVAESVGRTETDLTELRKSKKNGSSEAGSSSPVRAAQTFVPMVLNGHISKPPTQLKHRPLNALLGTPKGPIGKAVFPTKSPFEERYVENDNREWSAERPAKRMRLDQQSNWNITRTTTNVSKSVPIKDSMSTRTLESKKQKKARLEIGRQRLGTREIIDLSIDTDEQERFLDGFPRDALNSTLSPHKKQLSAKKPGPTCSSPPAFQRQSTPVSVPSRVSPDKVEQRDGPRVPDRQKGAKSAAVDVYVDDEPRQHQNRSNQGRDPPKREHVQQSGNAVEAQPSVTRDMRPLSSKSGKTLRMTASAPKKKTLLCQDQVAKKPSREHSANTEVAIDALLEVTSQDPILTKPNAKSQRRRLQERLARIGRKNATEGEEIINIDDGGIETPLAEPTTLKTKGTELQSPLNDSPRKVFELSQLIMPLERPASPKPPAVTKPMERQFRRVVSESNDSSSACSKRPPGAPVRLTPPLKIKSPTPGAEKETPVPIATIKSAPVPHPGPRTKKPILRSVSLNTASDGMPTVILGRRFRAPKAPSPKSLGSERCPDPWSREAFDLFTWRPPGWDEENWCLKRSGATAGTDV